MVAEIMLQIEEMLQQITRNSAAKKINVATN